MCSKTNESLDVIKFLRQTLDYHKGEHNTFFVFGASVRAQKDLIFKNQKKLSLYYRWEKKFSNFLIAIEL